MFLLSSKGKMIWKIDQDEVCQTPLTDSIGRQQETNIINESGLYNVITRCDASVPYV